MNRIRQPDEHVAQVGIHDAVNLSTVASSCAHTKREAKKSSGPFSRPYVGSNPNYFSHKAHSIFRRAVGADAELSRLYTRGGSLTRNLDYEYDSLYFTLGGPTVEYVTELVEVTEEIQDRLTGMDLRVDLSGKWLERAQDISAFALRVITNPIVIAEVHEAAARGEVRGTLYAGIPPEDDINRADYWTGLQQTLTPRSVTPSS